MKKGMKRWFILGALAALLVMAHSLPVSAAETAQTDDWNVVIPTGPVATPTMPPETTEPVEATVPPEVAPTEPVKPVEPTLPPETTPTEPVNPTLPATGTVKTKVNVRKEASVTSALVKSVGAGEKVVILEIVTVSNKDWGRIADGWILMDYVELNGSSAPTGGTCGDHLTWTFDSNSGTLTISGTGPMSDLSNSNQAPWYPYRNEIFSVTIGNGVTTVGQFAFADCGALKKVTLPDSIVAIAYGGFHTCSSLTQINLPKNLESIGGVAFKACESLTELTIPASVKTIEWYSFPACYNLKKVTFEGDAPAIGDDTFYDMTLTAYYPAGNATWTADVLKNYGGTITWVSDGAPSTPTPPFMATVKVKLNVRKNPDVMSGIVRQMEVGERVEILEIRTVDNVEWGRISGGWIVMNYVEPDSSSVIEGTCGRNLTWRLNQSTGVLTISGTGPMRDYTDDSSNPAPWSSFGHKVKMLVVEEGVTSIGDFAFVSCSEIHSAFFSGTLDRVGQYAFYRLTSPDGKDYHRPFWTSFHKTVRQWYAVSVEKGNEGFPSWDNTHFLLYLPVTASGKSGDNVYWELTEDGNMTFFGNGTMYEFWATGSPYYELPVKSILIGEGITNIGMNIFEAGSGDRFAQTLELVTIASTVKRVETTAFSGCLALKRIQFTGDAPEFGYDCFTDVTAVAYYPADNATWTPAVMQNYGGNITWLPYGGADDGHNPGTKWYSNSKEHWKKCADCNQKVELAPHVPGRDATQYSAQRCLICNRAINNPKILDWMAAANSDPNSTLWATGYYIGAQEDYGQNGE